MAHIKEHELAKARVPLSERCGLGGVALIQIAVRVGAAAPRCSAPRDDAGAAFTLAGDRAGAPRLPAPRPSSATMAVAIEGYRACAVSQGVSRQAHVLGKRGLLA